MKRFHHRLLVLCALVLMFALAASLSPAAYAEYPHLRGNKGLKADTEVTQSAQTPEPEAPVESADDPDMFVFEEPHSAPVPEEDEPDVVADPENVEPEDFAVTDDDPAETAATSEDEADPDAEYDNNLDDLDIEEILRANTYESVMKNHSAFTVKTVTNPDIAGYGSDGFYCGTDHYNYYEFDTEAETNGIAAVLVTEQNAYRLIQFADGDTGFYVEWIADPTRVDQINKLSESCMSLDAEAFRREILIDYILAFQGHLPLDLSGEHAAAIREDTPCFFHWRFD